MKLTDFIKRVKQLIVLGENVLKTQKLRYGAEYYVDTSLFENFRTSSLSFLKLSYGDSHPYYESFLSKVKISNPHNTQKGIGILNAVSAEMEGGWLISTKGIVSAEIFSDFLEMAEHLLEMDYKDPAAVLIGSVLEEHLRQLCQKHSIDTHRIKNSKQVPKKSDLLNADLAKAHAYNLLDQKSVTTWLDLRNNAAHGHYSEYDKNQVELMYQGVTNFILRNAL